ncbi:MAG: VWA domain-containing protein [Acidobacteriia bacterium]|nr:VWA domain-containing protein [Terriglobia bacterium]
MRARFACACLLAAAAGFLLAQEQVIRVDVRLVRLLVSVKDASGNLVGTLNKQDFQVIDSGVKQEIAIFEHNTEQPLSVALLVDTSGSTAKDLKYEVDSSVRFLRALVREGNTGDALSFFSFNHDVSLHASFTRNPAQVEKSLQKLRAEAGTSVYDALWFAAEELADRQGRHVVVIVSDGGDTTSTRSYQDALRAMHRADAVIYPIVVTPITSEAGRNVGGEHALISLSKSTGGRAFFPDVGPALDRAFTEILRDLRTQYLVGYYPKNLPESKSRFRILRVALTRPDLQVLTRSGYYE